MDSEVRVIESDSCWERFRERFMKPVYIIGAVIVILLVAITVAIPVILLRGEISSDDSSNPVDYSKALIVSDERDLWALDLNTFEKTLLTRTTKGISTFDVYRKTTILWRENGSQWINSLSLKFKNFTQPRQWSPESIAIDWSTENVYVLDALASTLNVHRLNGTKYGIVLSGLKNASSIALDSKKGLIFIVQRSNSILRGLMDGTSIRKIVMSSSVITCAVERQTRKIYWSDFEKIESSDYEGKNRMIVVQAAGAMSLGVSGSHLFWTLSPDQSKVRTLWNCITTNGICNDAGAQQIPFDDPKDIKVYTGPGLFASNPSHEENGGCQHLVLLTDGGKLICACHVGYRLKGDSRSCELVNEYLLYVRGTSIRGRLLDSANHAFTDTILPIHLKQPLELNEKRTIDFDFNYQTSTVALSDDRSISTVNLRSGSQGSYHRDRCLKQVSFDWVTNDIYYVRDNCRTASNTSISLLKPRESRYLTKTLYKFSEYKNHPNALVVHPNMGIHIFTVLHGHGTPQIYKMQGSKMTPLLEEGLSANESGLAIDSEEDRLYWFSQNTTLLYNANLEGKDVRMIDVSVVREPRSISVYGRYAYVANLTSVWRFDKLTGSGAIRLIPQFDDDSGEIVAGVRVYAPNVQKVTVDNPCAIKNGECEQFCFRKPRKVVSGPNAVNITDQLMKICLCDDFKEIYIDGKTCKEPGDSQYKFDIT